MIANYTTSVPVKKSVGEVFEILADMGASSISIRTDSDKTPSGVGFELAGPNGPRSFELPLQIEGVRKAMANEGAPASKTTREHAARVAWRIAKDWLRAQAALIEAHIAQLDQIMLPYLVTDPGTRETLYDRYIANERRLALEGADGG